MKQATPPKQVSSSGMPQNCNNKQTGDNDKGGRECGGGRGRRQEEEALQNQTKCVTTSVSAGPRDSGNAAASLSVTNVLAAVA